MALGKRFLPDTANRANFRCITENKVFAFLSLTYVVFQFFFTENKFSFCLLLFTLFLALLHREKGFCLFAASHADCSYLTQFRFPLAKSNRFQHQINTFVRLRLIELF